MNRTREPIVMAEHWSATRVGAALTSLVAAGSLLFFAAIKMQDKIDVGLITRDPQVTTESPWYLGAASMIGVVGWAIATGILGFAATLSVVDKRPRTTTLALGTAALWSLLLLIDDLLLLHDDLLLRLLPDDRPILVIYAIGFAIWLYKFAGVFPRGARLPLLAAIAGFAASAAIDFAWSIDSDWRLVLEDGTKFLGIWSWTVFAAVWSAITLRPDLDKVNDR
ncbi:MAG: hypothetical protein GY939_00590 [Actinomycetia bacterium]|nr:hypothetical protein [Actinomycetes bacterium]